MAAELRIRIHTCPLVQLWALKRAWTHNCTCSFECDCRVCEIKGEPYRDPLQKVWLQAESPTMSDSVLMVLLLPLYPIALPFICPSSSPPHPFMIYPHQHTPFHTPILESYGTLWYLAISTQIMWTKKVSSLCTKVAFYRNFYWFPCLENVTPYQVTNPKICKDIGYLYLLCQRGNELVWSCLVTMLRGRLWTPACRLLQNNRNLCKWYHSD